MKVIGFTGGIGSGKSTITAYLEELGAVVIDADKVGHEAFEPNTDIWREVIAAFGADILDAENRIDRKKLGSIVFKDPNALSRLNAIMHPRMYEIMKARIEDHRCRGTDVVVIEAAVLIEANWMSLADEIWVATAPESVVIERLEKQRGMDREQILTRIRSQLTPQDRAKHADVIIINDGSLEELRTEVRQLWDRLRHTRDTAMI